MNCNALRGLVLVIPVSGLMCACGGVAARSASPAALALREPAGARTLPLWSAVRVSGFGPQTLMTSVQWGGQEGPQSSNTLIPNTHLLTAVTSPVATLDVPNTSPAAQTYEIDLFVADQPPPRSWYGSSTTIPRSSWPGVIWDWASQRPTPVDSVTVPAHRRVEVPLDWPGADAKGDRVGLGDYWAVVTANLTTRPGQPTNPAEANPVANFEEENPIRLVSSLPPLPREDCLGYPAAPTVSGLPSPFPVSLEPGVTVPGATTTFAGIDVHWQCTLSGAKPEVAVIAFTNPGSSAVTWRYHLFASLWNTADNAAGALLCDAAHSAPAVDSGTMFVPPRGVASVTLWWPQCSGNPAPPAPGFYLLEVNANSGVYSSDASEVVRLDAVAH